MIRIGMSSSSVYPLGIREAFRVASAVGFDGIELMITRDELTRDAEGLRALSEAHGLPILSVHAPVLLLTHFVWGRDPRVKLERSARLAADVGAGSVVVHPPFRWQSGYAEHFLEIVREVHADSGVEIAVENMFPWRVRGRGVTAYSPGWNPAELDCDAAVLDFSHAALSGLDALDLAERLGERLRHVHLCDGSSPIDENHVFDEHLIPGRGAQPVAEVLRLLAERRFTGSIVAEVNTRKAKTERGREAMLRETLAFARAHTGDQRLLPTSRRALGSLLAGSPAAR